jgi:hypothetical protein
MSDNDTNIQATLNYIDKVYSEITRTGTAINRAVLVTLTVSTLQLLAAAGWVSTEGDMSLLGLGVKATFVVLLLCSMLILVCLVAYWRALSLRGHVLWTEIRRLYTTIGYVREASAMHDSLASPFRSLHFSRLLAAQHSSTLYPPPSPSLERPYAKYSSYAMEILVRGFPTLAELAGTVKLAYIGWPILWWVPTLAFAVATATTMLAYPSRYYRGDAADSSLPDDASSDYRNA